MAVKSFEATEKSLPTGQLTTPPVDEDDFDVLGDGVSPESEGRITMGAGVVSSGGRIIMGAGVVSSARPIFVGELVPIGKSRASGVGETVGAKAGAGALGCWTIPAEKATVMLALFLPQVWK